MTTLTIIVAPASTGFGVIDALWMAGTLVSRVTVLVTLLVFPAASVAVTIIVLLPSANVTDLEKLPSDAKDKLPLYVQLS